MERVEIQGARKIALNIASKIFKDHERTCDLIQNAKEIEEYLLKDLENKD